MASANRSTLQHRVWRWHFFAGLMVIPFAVILAITGCCVGCCWCGKCCCFQYRRNIPAQVMYVYPPGQGPPGQGLPGQGPPDQGPPSQGSPSQ